jgi:hypothetical protein
MLRENHLYVKFSKCDFFQKEIQYLGHIISIEGVAVYPKKIKETMDWSTPRNVTKVSSFMGLVGYYRIFIRGFYNIGNPITSLQIKGNKFVWSPECEASF